MELELPYFGPGDDARLRAAQQEAAYERMMRDVYGSDADPGPYPVMARRPSAARYTQWEAMGVKPPWYVRLRAWLKPGAPLF